MKPWNRHVALVALLSRSLLTLGCNGGDAGSGGGGGASSCEADPQTCPAATVEVFATDVTGAVNRQMLGTALSNLYRERWRKPENLEDPALVSYFQDLGSELFVIDNTMLGFPFYPKSTGPKDQRLSYMELFERVGIGPPIPPTTCQDCGADVECQVYCATKDVPEYQLPPHKGYDEVLQFIEKVAPTSKVCMRIPTIFTTLLGPEVYSGLDLRSLKIDIDPQTAVNLLEYLNGDAVTTTLGKLRSDNGHPSPYDVRCFMLGNEMWVNYAIADMPMQQIVDQTLAFANAMKAVDATVEIGFNLFALVDFPDAPWPEHFAPGMAAAYAKYMDFNEPLLGSTASVLDFVTLHVYGYGAAAGLASHPEPSSYTDAQWRFALAFPAIMERYGLAAGVRSYVDRFNPGLKIVVDEYAGASGSQTGALYNTELLLYLQRSGFAFATNWASGLFEPHTRFGLVKVWEDPTQTPVRRPAYYALQMLAGHLGDELVRAEVTAPTFDTEATDDAMLLWPAETAIPGVSATASRSQGSLSVLLVNRMLNEDLEVRVSLQGVTASGDASLTVLSAPDPAADNEAQADTVVSVHTTVTTEPSGLTVTVPAHSLLALTTSVQ